MIRSAGTAVLTVLTVACAVAGLGLAGWTAWQGAESAGAVDRQERAAAAVERSWPTPTATPTDRIPVAAAPRRNAATVATIRVPRFGSGWVRTVRQGVGADVLDSVAAGVGHYPGTGMPGAVGNFAVAGHDTGWGDAFRGLATLRVGDEIRVEDGLGTYMYAFRNLRWVQPRDVGVLLPVPERPHAPIAARLITLTTCDPPYHAAERLVGYGELVRFTPRDGTARVLASRHPSSAPADRMRSALRSRPLHPAAVVASLRAAGFAGRIETTQPRTSVGRPVPSMQIGVAMGSGCLVGQLSAAGRVQAVRALDPIAGRCLLTP